MKSSSAYQRTCSLIHELTSGGYIPPDIDKAPMIKNEHYWSTPLFSSFLLSFSFSSFPPSRRPSFRTVAETKEPLELIESGYYYKIGSDYSVAAVPEPYILRFDMNPLKSPSHGHFKKDPLEALLGALQKADSFERIVLQLYDSSVAKAPEPLDIIAWSEDSVGSWSARTRASEHEEERRVNSLRYLMLPRAGQKVRENEAVKSLFICNSFLHYTKSNRTCFDKC